MAVPYCGRDEDSQCRTKTGFVPQIQNLQPKFVSWEFGYDARKGEYGDKRLTNDCHVETARIIKSTADESCQGKLLTVLCGGSRRDLATYVILKGIYILGELD